MTVAMGMAWATRPRAFVLAAMLSITVLGVSARPAPPPVYAYDVSSCMATTAKSASSMLECRPSFSRPASFHVYDGDWRQLPNMVQQFTGKERDAETGLDWFGTRYLSSAQGRFTSPDKPFADQTPFDPQSWNLYSYTRNNPLKYVDRTGEAIETAWDVLNIGLGVKSFVDNVRSGNYGSAALDAVGVVVDSAAAAVPFIPGGAGAVIKAGRMAENAADVVGALNRSDNVVDAVRATDTAADANKLVPNPYGKKGGPAAHQAKVDDVVANIEGRGLTAQKEVRIDTPGGSKQKRYADVVARDANGKIVEIHQVGKQGWPTSIPREASNR
jgi:RHS repeat-associated protein